VYVTHYNGKVFTVMDTKRFIRHLETCKESRYFPGYFFDQDSRAFKVSDYPDSKALTRTEIYERE
jgi:hypothetical protein